MIREIRRRQEEVKAKSTTIVIFGANGQLGMDLQSALSTHRLEPLTDQAPDILDRSRVADTLKAIQPDWVINAAALTNVDWCEDNDLEAFRVNALGARHIAEALAPGTARIIQISTDYVFDGAKGTPYVEDDAPHPLNVYGITKLAGENYVRSTVPRHYVIRTAGLYGTHPCWGKGTNFVEKMLGLARSNETLRVVCDEVLTPTFTEDLSEQIRVLIDTEPPYGIYHATNAGGCSWYEFAKTIFELSGMDIDLGQTTAAEWNAPAKRPANSVLENNALSLAGIDVMPHWQDALKRYLAKKTKGSDDVTVRGT